MAALDRLLITRRVAEAVAAAYWKGYLNGILHSSYVWFALILSAMIVAKIRKHLR